MAEIKALMSAGKYSEPLQTEQKDLPAKLAAVAASMGRIADLHQQVTDDPDMDAANAQDVADVYNAKVDVIQQYAAGLTKL